MTNFASYNATCGAIGGAIVLMLWFYMSSLAVLIGAELNAEIDHASPYRKEPGDKEIGEKRKIGRGGHPDLRKAQISRETSKSKPGNVGQQLPLQPDSH